MLDRRLRLHLLAANDQEQAGVVIGQVHPEPDGHKIIMEVNGGVKPVDIFQVIQCRDRGVALPGLGFPDLFNVRL